MEDFKFLVTKFSLPREAQGQPRGQRRLSIEQLSFM